MSPACESSPECCPVSKWGDLRQGPGAEKYGASSCEKEPRVGAEGRADDGWGGASVSEGSAIVGPVNLPGRDLGNPLARPGQPAERSRFAGAATNCRSQLIAAGYSSTRVVCTRFFSPVAAPPLAFPVLMTARATALIRGGEPGTRRGPRLRKKSTSSEELMLPAVGGPPQV
jgi:hypothetical protein